MSKPRPAAADRGLPDAPARHTVPISLLPDLSLPELHHTGGGSSVTQEGVPAPGPPSVLQKLQKWGDYPSYGEPVQPTLFLPMKTPLSTTIHQGWTLPTPPLHSLTVQQLLAEQALKRRTVGLILDLSNHATLYAEDLPAGLQYEHIMLQSKVFPHPAAINEVVHAARSFWSRQPSQYIAIHCAYGFNRTGFVVCSYLIQACGLSVEAALASFAAARPPGVKHEQFVAELHARYPAASSRPCSGHASAATCDVASAQQQPPAAPGAISEMAPAPNPCQDGPGERRAAAASGSDGSCPSASQDKQPAAKDSDRLQSVPALEQNSQQQAAHSRPHLWHNNCTPSNLRDSVSNGVHQQQPSPPEHCSHLLELPRICRNQAPSTCGLSQAADDLFTRPPSQGVENDSLGLDQRMIMSELAASRLKARSQRRLETLVSIKAEEETE